MRSFSWVVLAACGGGGDGTDVDGGTQVDARMIDAPTGPTITKTYQQGVDGYTATKSVGISTYGGLGNIGEYNANGMTFADGLNDWCTGTDIPSGNYSEVWLIRFESLDIPAGSQVVSASFSMHGYGDGGSDLFFTGSYMAVAWYGDTPIGLPGCSQAPGGWGS